MKYHELTIRWNGHRKRHDIAVRLSDGAERAARPVSHPSATGYYHFPVSMPVETALAALKEVMLADGAKHIEQIANAMAVVAQIKLPRGVRGVLEANAKDDD